MFRRTVLSLMAVAAVGLVAGVAVAGRPTPVNQNRFAAPSTTSTTTTAAPTTTIDQRPTVNIAIVGDSYTGGSQMGGTGPANWTEQLRTLLPDVRMQLTVSAEGGAGYVQAGQAGDTFVALTAAIPADAAVVIVFGSRNDGSSEPDTIRASAEQTYARIATIAPGARLLVIGPPWVDANIPGGISDARDAVQAAADEAGATFLDPLADGWFTGPNTALIGTDGVHPTDDGHAYMAALIAPHVEALLTT